MAATTRTFIAIELPSKARTSLERLQGRLASVAPAVRWVRSEQLHLTLVFLGEVADTDLAAVCRIVEHETARFAPFELRLEGLGAFPNPRRPRTLWAGVVGSEVEELLALQSALSEALCQAGWPQGPEERFLPHVTLGRPKDSRSPGKPMGLLIDEFRDWTGPALPVKEVLTFSSELIAEGPLYTVLSRAPLGPENAEAPA